MAGDSPGWEHSPGEGGISADTIHNIHSEEGVFPTTTTSTTTSSAEEPVPSVSLSPGTFQPFQPGNYPYLMGPRFSFGPVQSYDLNYQPWTQAYWEANNLPMGLMAYNYPGGGILAPGGTSGVNLPVSAPGGLIGSTAGSTAGSTTSSNNNNTNVSTTTNNNGQPDDGGGTQPDGDTGNPYIDEDPVIRQARAEIGRYTEDQLRNWNFGDLDPYDTESMIMDEAREFGLLNSETEILRDQLYNNPIGLISTPEPGIPQQNATTGEIAVAAAKQAEADRIASIPDVINRAVAIRAAEKAPSGDMERRAADAAAKAAQAARNRAKAAAAQAARDRAAQAAAHQRNVAKAAALAAAQAERDRQSRAQAAAAAAADRKRAEAIFAADRRNQSSVEAVLASLRGAGSGIGAGAGNRGGIGRLGSGPLGHSADVGRASMGRAF
jgi:hypothetical protein